MKLLPEGDIFRSVDYAGKEEVDKSDAACLEIPMAVLVNEDSYSAAEFLAAALQEYGRRRGGGNADQRQGQLPGQPSTSPTAPLWRCQWENTSRPAGREPYGCGRYAGCGSESGLCLTMSPVTMGHWLLRKTSSSRRQWKSSGRKSLDRIIRGNTIIFSAAWGKYPSCRVIPGKAGRAARPMPLAAALVPGLFGWGIKSEGWIMLWQKSIKSPAPG